MIINTTQYANELDTLKVTVNMDVENKIVVYFGDKVFVMLNEDEADRLAFHVTSALHELQMIKDIKSIGTSS